MAAMIATVSVLSLAMRRSEIGEDNRLMTSSLMDSAPPSNRPEPRTPTHFTSPLLSTTLLNPLYHNQSWSAMNLFEVRRARVRAEFAWLYPEIVPGVWMSARKAAQLVRRSPRPDRRPSGERVLPDTHFEFRGGRRSRQAASGVWTPRGDALTA